jgi:ribose 5-phosphate isomerase B
VKIAIGSDHAGFHLKTILIKSLIKEGYDVHDLGTYNEEPVDYPDFAKKVADTIASKTCEKGVVICGSGVGASIAANKIKGIRASVCHDTYSAHQGVEHDDMNILVMGSRIVGECLALEILYSFLHAQFSNEERHVIRLKKVILIENS